MTYLTLKSTNEDLLEISRKDKQAVPVSALKTSETDVKELLETWGERNLIQAAIATLGTALGVWASINWPTWKAM